jgi:hypothetical protein
MTTKNHAFLMFVTPAKAGVQFGVFQRQRPPINDELVKSRNSIEFVIPAKAGIQLFQDVLDPGFRRGDAPRDFLRDHQLMFRL